MTTSKTPDWINNLHKPLPPRDEYAPEIDIAIEQRLQQLSLEELDTLADTSGIRESLGVLMPSDGWSKEQYIEVLSDTSEMNDAQISRLYTLLGIET